VAGFCTASVARPRAGWLVGNNTAALAVPVAMVTSASECWQRHWPFRLCTDPRANATSTLIHLSTRLHFSAASEGGGACIVALDEGAAVPLVALKHLAGPCLLAALANGRERSRAARGPAHSYGQHWTGFDERGSAQFRGWPDNNKRL
jgi:hypothetical protein